jgi:polyphosphate kinase
LEHSRVYWFQNGTNPQTYIGSADWMDRNLKRRVEALVPIRSADLKRWIRDVLLERYLRDNTRTRLMQSDGSYTRSSSATRDVHQDFLDDLPGST